MYISDFVTYFDVFYKYFVPGQRPQGLFFLKNNVIYVYLCIFMYMYAYFLVPWYPPGQKSHIKKSIPPLDRTDGHPSIPPWLSREG